MSEPGGDPSSGISSGDALIRPERHPACRRREARPGFRMERENLCFVTPPGVKGQAASGSNPNVDNLIKHDLNDIYLLLDHLSGRADRNVAGIELDQGSEKRNLIDAVCEIKWPAKEGKAQWEQAAILFKARDKLNQLAAPATGLT